MTAWPTPVGTTGGPKSAAGPHAFTLIEILVVITIFMILMGLTIGSVVRAPKVNRMIASEQAIADCIRQARHTARTTGQPVVLLLKRNERSIGGLVRTTLWSRISGWPAPQPVAPATLPGRTGDGLWLPEAFDQTDHTNEILAGDPVLDRNTRLARGVVTPSQGIPTLLLSLNVRLPVAGPAAGMAQPLVHVGKDVPGNDADFASIDNSLFGLAVVRADDVVANANTNLNTRAGLRRPVTPTWEILGWIRDSGNQYEVSSILDVPTGATRVEANQALLKLAGGADDPSSMGFDIAAPLVGGQWCELSLLFDGTRLVLYRDGRRVGEKAVTITNLYDAQGPERVYIGVLKAPLGTGPAAYVAPQALTIDDVRLERLGHEMIGTLPAGVTLGQAECRITCHPEGRVEVNAAEGGEITLTSESGENALISIDVAGSVRSVAAATGTTAELPP